MKAFLELLQTILLIVYCIFGSAAFLKYLLQEERGSSSSHPKKRSSQSRQRPKAHPAPAAAPAQQAPPVQMPETPVPEAPPEPQRLPERIPEPAGYPPEPPPGVPTGVYEVANPGYKLSDGYQLQLQPSSDGVLLACLVGDTFCVYVQPGLEEAGVNLKWFGLQHLYDMYDKNGKLHRSLPDGRLRIQNLQPAVCARYGSNLTLISRGKLVVLPIGETAYTNQGF